MNFDKESKIRFSFLFMFVRGVCECGGGGGVCVCGGGGGVQ